MSKILTFSAFAQNVCEIHSLFPYKELIPPASPNYFFKISPLDGSYFFASSEQNFIFDPQSQKLSNFAGYVDPIPSPDGLFITIPNQKENETGLIFLDPHNKTLFKDPDLKGVYQSVGIISSQTQGKSLKKIYRVATDRDGISFRDYEVTQMGTSLSFKPIGKPIVACPQRDLKFPVISKDGNYLIARDEKNKHKTTRIYRLLKDQSCPEVFDTGLVTGKAEFNYIGDKIAFHTDKQFVNQVSNGYNRETFWTTDVYVMDLKNKNLTQITQNPEFVSSYFPTWTTDGHLVYLHRNPGKGKSFRKVNLERNSSAIACENSSIERSLLALYESLCSGGKESSQFSQKGSILKLDHCSTLIQEALKKATTIEDKNYLQTLLKECPQEQQYPKPLFIDDPRKILQVRCSHCHENIEQKLLTTPQSSQSISKTFAEEAIRRTAYMHVIGLDRAPSALRMPPGPNSVLPNSEETILRTYLRDLIQSRK